MEHLEKEHVKKAKDLYLRGFSSRYIYRRTGIYAQELKKLFPEIDKQTIMRYQIQYIQEHYAQEEIRSELEQKLSFPNAINQVKQRGMILLGCAFGPYGKVFSTLLGQDVFTTIDKECEKFRKSSPPISGKEARRLTLLDRYGVEGPNGDPEIAGRMLETLRTTNQSRYGVDYAMQRKDVADLGARRRQETMMTKYGAPNSTQVPEIREKILNARVSHGTMTSSAHENALYEMLCAHYGSSNVIRNFLDEDRYPFRVDFYIPSEDLFIELNVDRSHGGHWFDETSEKDLERKTHMLRRAKELDLERKPSDKAHKSRYWNFVRVWTELDVQKRETARDHSLNYLVFWDDKKVMRNSVLVPRLKDACEWFDAGCPRSVDWRKENTW